MSGEDVIRKAIQHRMNGIKANLKYPPTVELTPRELEVLKAYCETMNVIKPQLNWVMECDDGKVRIYGMEIITV